MGRAEGETGIGRRKRSAWRHGLLATVLPLGLLAWQVDPALIFPAAPAAAAPAPAMAPVEISEPLPLMPPLPPPPPAIGPRVPQHIAQVSLELPPRHRRAFLAQALAVAAAAEAAAATDPAPLPPVQEEVYPLGLPDNPLTDLRPLYFVDGPGGGGLPLVRPHKLPPAPVPEPGTGLLVAFGLGASAAAARRQRPAEARPRGRPRPAHP